MSKKEKSPKKQKSPPKAKKPTRKQKAELVAKLVDTQPIMLIDGKCAFCNGAANFVIDHETSKNLKFESLQSETGQLILEYFGEPTDKISSYVIVRDGKIYHKYRAVVQMLLLMGGKWEKLGKVGKWYPAFLGDMGYTVLWPMRKIFGYDENVCKMPTPELKARMLDLEAMLMAEMAEIEVEE